MRRPLPPFALNPDVPAVQLHQFLGDRQPQPDPLAVHFLPRLHLLERLEQSCLVLPLDADAMVLHGKLQIVPDPLRAHRDVAAGCC